jgi:hypothetical protein
MSSVVISDRHTARSGVRGALLVALLAFLITAFTPGFANVPLPAGADCAVVHLAYASPSTVGDDDDDVCETPQAFVLPLGDLNVHRDAPHHRRSHRACIASACHPRSRLTALGWHQVVGDAFTPVTAAGAQGRAPASAQHVSGLQLPQNVILRC